ncbi:MAG: hypothetical protein L0H53_07060 [Candidatus Nitrosocosmicus sp.]|nr:hypothetical protein [Candidatus Nitrosocosmicus sp.]MDN5868185.1 hypothetical protein [Candidatus Nitrosocosmicus sp.]
MNQGNNDVGKIAQKVSEQAPSVIDQILNKLTGRHASITYTFEDFRINMPKAEGPQGSQIGGGELSIRGSIKITGELHKKQNSNGEDGNTSSNNNVVNSSNDASTSGIRDTSSQTSL